MNTPAERKMLGAFQQMSQAMSKANGAAPFTTMLERGFGDRGMDARDSNHPSRLIVSIYGVSKVVEPPKVELPDADKDAKGKDAKPEPKAAAAKISLKLELETELPDGTPYLLMEAKVDALGTTELEIPQMAASYRLSVKVAGDVEYAVFGW